MVPWSTYTGTNLETADTAKEDLQLIGISSTRSPSIFQRVAGSEASPDSTNVLFRERCREAEPACSGGASGRMGSDATSSSARYRQMEKSR
jgi:hypothetical protein